MKPKLFIAAKAFVTHNGKVLLLRESGQYEDGTNTGRYDVPGGRLNPGEKFNELLLREVREETGLDVKIIKPIAVNEWRPEVRGEKWQIIGVFFECQSDSDKVSLSADHDACLWIDPDKYNNYPIIENLKKVFAEYQKVKK